MLSIKADFVAAERLLSDLGRKQLPFATAMAINDTAESVKRAEELDIAQTFDRPTPFTKKGLYLRRASKNRLAAQVGAKRVQAGYLARQVTGGTRRPKGQALVVPVKAKRNAYGNLPKGALQRLGAKRNVFATKKGAGATRHLPPGVYQRMGRKGNDLRLLVAFEPSAQYGAQWKFHDLAMRRARAVFRNNFVRRLRQAIATAK